MKHAVRTPKLVYWAAMRVLGAAAYSEAVASVDSEVSNHTQAASFYFRSLIALKWIKP